MSVPAAALPPLSLYLHFPWCVSKCPYCDFNSHALRDELPEHRYIESLLADIRAQAPQVAGRPVQTIFLGGGTPSLFTPDALARLFAGIRGFLSVDPDAEVTLEANPATVERGRFSGYRDAGINRVSLGAQSFDPAKLKVLGRIHHPADVVRAAEELHVSGLSNFNLDLMYALPGQDIAGAIADLAAALSLHPAHVSHYQLTLEPGTLFAARPPPLPDDDLAWSMQVECQALLAARGFAQYEVSAYAIEGRQSRHNLNYWSFGDYLGAGAGAHGKVSSVDERGLLSIRRSTHLREPRRYFATAADGPQWTSVAPRELPFEFMLNALRLTAGFEASSFSLRTGQLLQSLAPVLSLLEAQGLLQSAAGRWCATPAGRQYLNDVIARFLPDAISQTATGS
jgi:oxygen-independent coproporphyrinogen-3 oxidase